MSADSDDMAPVAGLSVDAFGEQVEAIQEALVVLAEAGIDVSDVSMDVDGGALAADVTLDGEQLVEADLSRPNHEQYAASDTVSDADSDPSGEPSEGDGIEDNESVDDGTGRDDGGGNQSLTADAEAGASDGSEEPDHDGDRTVAEEVVEDPTTTAEIRLAIASLADLDYLNYEGDKPPQFSKRNRIEIARSATSLDEDVIEDFNLSGQAEAAVLAHGLDVEAAERQYYKKDELEKIHRQLVGHATAPGVPDEHLPEPGEQTADESGDAAATDGGAVVDDGGSNSGPTTLAERVEAMDSSASIPDEVSLAEFEATIDEHTYLREAAADLGMERGALRVVLYKLGWYADRIQEGRAYGGGER